jgi:hypothetical protein
MKTVIYSFIVGIFFLGFVSCKSPKVITVEQATGSVEVKGPFDEPKFRTDKDFFRSYQSYKHPNENTARTYAATLARAELLAQVKSDLSAFIKGNETTYDKDGQDVSGILITRIAQLTEDIVTDAIVVDSKMYKEQDGRYTCYTLVEKSRSAVLNKAYSKTISDDDKMKILFEKKKIEEDYEKFKASQKN